ncbi:hypothetical protein AAFF_G00023640 [Aldrovandia affinis]|uniref:Uncharacterized protein n=1 Tax=Aldrovandia affinis TaxID=143900 RepID=A0AAD7T5Q9_9TELE|nr:hypothetical protein AAFF_G00023640 [Aldrovandia affinis]
MAGYYPDPLARGRSVCITLGDRAGYGSSPPAPNNTPATLIREKHLATAFFARGLGQPGQAAFLFATNGDMDRRFGFGAEQRSFLARGNTHSGVYAVRSQENLKIV